MTIAVFVFGYFLFSGEAVLYRFGCRCSVFLWVVVSVSIFIGEYGCRVEIILD